MTRTFNSDRIKYEVVVEPCSSLPRIVIPIVLFISVLLLAVLLKAILISLIFSVCNH